MRDPDLYVLYHIVLGIQRASPVSAAVPIRLGARRPRHLRRPPSRYSCRRVRHRRGGCRQRELVWRGIGIDEIDVYAKPEKRDAAIDKAVEKILVELSAETRPLKRPDDHSATERTERHRRTGTEIPQGHPESRISVTGRRVPPRPRLPRFDGCDRRLELVSFLECRRLRDFDVSRVGCFLRLRSPIERGGSSRSMALNLRRWTSIESLSRGGAVRGRERVQMR